MGAAADVLLDDLKVLRKDLSSPSLSFYPDPAKEGRVQPELD